ncbi:hypothetical protein Tco_0616362 [Tanacetum coccineum]
MDPRRKQAFGWLKTTKFQEFIYSKFTFDYDTKTNEQDTYFVEYTGLGRFNTSEIHYSNTWISKKKIQKRDRNSTTSVPTSARIQTTTDDRKLSRSLPVSKSSRVTITAVPKADHSKEVNSRAKIQSNKTTNSNKPVDQKSHTQKPSRQIFTGHRWISTGKLFDSCTSKVDSEPPHGSNVDIPHIHECKQTLDVSAGTSINVQKEQSLDLSAGGSLLQPPITKTKSAQIESRARRDHSINLIRTQCQNTLVGHHKVHRSYALSWKPCQGDSLNLPDHRAQVDQGSQIKMIQVKEMMQDNDLKNSKSKDKGSKSRSQSMDEQSHYKQDKTITRQSINVKRHIFNVIGGTEEFEERDLNIGGDC